MRQALVLEAGSLLGIGIFAISAFAFSVSPAAAPQPAGDGSAHLQSALELDGAVLGEQVDVQIRDGVAHLSGLVVSSEARDEAGRIARRTAGVTGLVNDLIVGERVAEGWVSDELLTARVRSRLLEDPAIAVGDVDVSSTDGVVTLTGRVGSPSIRDEAARLARTAPGAGEIRNHLLTGFAGG